MPEIQTYIIEAKYDEADDAGGYVWIGRAYSDEQAYRMCAMQMILDNDWHLGDCARQYTSLKDAFEEELTVLHESGDQDGDSCPACTSANARNTMVDFAGSGGTIRECKTCHYQWVPLGRKLLTGEPSEAQIDAELAEFETMMAQDPEEREEEA